VRPSQRRACPPASPRAMPVWPVGSGPRFLRPLIGLPLRSRGKERGGGGWECWLAVCCVRMDGALRTFHDAVAHTIARIAVDAGFEWRWRCIVYAVYGMFTINVHSRSA
jgi:hypothetical protein